MVSREKLTQTTTEPDSQESALHFAAFLSELRQTYLDNLKKMWTIPIRLFGLVSQANWALLDRELLLLTEYHANKKPTSLEIFHQVADRIFQGKLDTEIQTELDLSQGTFKKIKLQLCWAVQAYFGSIGQGEEFKESVDFITEPRKIRFDDDDKHSDAIPTEETTQVICNAERLPEIVLSESTVWAHIYFAPHVEQVLMELSQGVPIAEIMQRAGYKAEMEGAVRHKIRKFLLGEEVDFLRDIANKRVLKQFLNGYFFQPETEHPKYLVDQRVISFLQAALNSDESPESTLGGHFSVTINYFRLIYLLSHDPGDELFISIINKDYCEDTNAALLEFFQRGWCLPEIFRFFLDMSEKHFLEEIEKWQQDIGLEKSPWKESVLAQMHSHALRVVHNITLFGRDEANIRPEVVFRLRDKPAAVALKKIQLHFAKQKRKETIEREGEFSFLDFLPQQANLTPFLEDTFVHADMADQTNSESGTEQPDFDFLIDDLEEAAFMEGYPDLFSIYRKETQPVVLTAEEEITFGKAIELAKVANVVDLAQQAYYEMKTRQDLTTDELLNLQRVLNEGMVVTQTYPEMITQGTDFFTEAAAEAKEALTTSGYKLVITLAQNAFYKLQGNYQVFIPFLDLIQEANMGLLKAVERFDYTKGYRFLGVAYWDIRKSIDTALDTHGRTIRRAGNIRDRLRHLDQARRKLRVILNHEPSVSELSAELPDDYNVPELLEDEQHQVLSLEFKLGDGEDAGELGEIIPDLSQDSVETQAELHLENELFYEVMNELTKKEIEILNLLFGLKSGKQLSAEEVAKKLNLKQSQVTEVKKKAIKRLRRKLLKRGFEREE